MVLDQSTNFARGETTSSIASTETTIDVANASTFADPAGGAYNLVLWDQTQYPRPTASGASPEIVRVSGRDTTNDTLTVSRGQEGTTAGAFPSGAALIHTQTAKTFGDIDSTFASFWDEQNQELTADINATNGDIESLSTNELWGETDILVTGPSGALIHRIDPASSNTPVQDAIETAFEANSGDVWIPPIGDIDHSGGPITPKTGVTIHTPGYRPGPNADQPHAIKFAGTDNGFEIPSGEFVTGFQIDGGLVLEGPGSGGTQTGNAVDITGDMNDFDIDAIIAQGWRGKFIRMDPSSRVFQGNIGHLNCTDIDAGDGQYLIDWRLGNGIDIRNITVYPRNPATGNTIEVFNFANALAVDIGTVNIGGVAERIGVFSGSECNVNWGVVNWEPSPTQSPTSLLSWESSDSATSFPIVKIAGGSTPTHVYEINGFVGSVFLPPPTDITKTSGEWVVVNSGRGQDEVAIWCGPSNQVNIAAQALNPPGISCLADLVTKTS